MQYHQRVRLDRYAIKDPDAELGPGDLVVASVERTFDREARKVESREIGIVVLRHPDDHYDVKIDNAQQEILKRIPRNRLEYVVERTYGDICQRVAHGAAQHDEAFESLMYELLVQEKFVGAGRILAGVGRDDYTLTLFNCYVFDPHGDSRADITAHWGRLFETYARGGGVGTPLSVLRPRGSVVRKVNGRSSGSCSWAEQFSQITGAVEQGGCFALDSKIETDRGDIPASEVAKLVETHKYGTVYAKTHEGNRPITKVFRNGSKPVVELWVERDNWIGNTKVSVDHRVVAKREGDYPTVPGLDGWMFVPAGELKQKDIIGVLDYERGGIFGLQGKRTVVEGKLLFPPRDCGEQEVVDFEVGTTHLLSSEGIYTSNSRRGALMLCQWCWHPDVEELIQAKAEREEFRTPSGDIVSRNKKLLYNANVSIMLTNDFMRAVQQDDDWDLVFPDLNDPDYDAEWDGNLHRWKDQLGKKIVKYRTIKAKSLWDQIIQRAWESGEPGLIFMERANDMSNSYYYDDLVGTNPCAEQPLPADGCCNLSHINLSRFVLPEDQLPDQERTSTDAAKRVDWDGIETAVRAGIRFLDNIIDINQYHEDAIERQQTKERRIGLGLLGYGEMLLRLGLRYGSEESIKFTDRLMKHFSTNSYLASVELAKQRGSFPEFDAEKFLKSGFMKRHAKVVRDAVEQYGIRNVTVNTVAPTGSVASLLQTSSGCEPFFDLEYISTTRIGVVTEQPPIIVELTNRFGPDRRRWPDYVVTAQNGITPEQHVRTQATIQRWIDSALSKTINLPQSATQTDIADAYRLMWELGCKGGTVYRDGSRDEQVLYRSEPLPEEVEVEVVESGGEDLGIIMPRPDVGYSVTFSEESPIGTVHATLRHDPKSGEPRDLFISLGKGDTAADAEAIGRLISMILRWPNNRHINQNTRLEIVRDQLIDILGRGQVGYGPQQKRSLPDTIAKIINRYLSAEFPMSNIPFGFDQMKSLLSELRSIGGDLEAFDKVVDYVLHGHTNGKSDEEAVEQYREAMEQTVQEIEAEGGKLPYDYCPDCGNHTLVTIPGKCPYCRNCGYTRC